MQTSFTAKFSKDLDKLSDDAVKEALAGVIEQVEAAARLSEIVNLKKLKGFKTAYRIRMGEYRIGLFIIDGTIEFARFVHRKDIYRLFP